MTPKEFFERLQDALQAACWDGTSNPIFGDAVYVVPQVPAESLSRFPRICCFLTDEGTVFDPVHPSLMWQNANLHVFAENVQDALGTAVMTGGCRVSGDTPGAGLLDIHYALTRAVMAITSLVSRVVIVEKSSPGPRTFGGANYPAVTKIFSLSAIVSTGDASPSPAEILHVPGLLYWNPTSLTAPINYGTLLGFTLGGVTLTPNVRHFDVRTEETGDTLYARYYAGQTARVSCVCRSWNGGMLAACFPGQGATTSVSVPGSLLPGSSLSTYAKPLLFLPVLATDPCLLVKKAWPSPGAAARMLWSHSEGLNVLAEFDAGYNSSGSASQYYIGPISGASL